LRKTARHLYGNAGYKDDEIKKIMGESPNSKVMDHYANYEGTNSQAVIRIF